MDVTDFDLFGHLSNEETRCHSLFIPLYFYNMHQENSDILCYEDPGYFENFSAFIAMLAYKRQWDYDPAIAEMVLSDIESYADNLKLALKLIFTSYYIEDDHHQAYAEMCAYALESIFWLVEVVEEPKEYIRKTIEVVARLFNSDRFGVDTSFHRLCLYADLMSPMSQDAAVLLAISRSRIRARLPLTAEDIRNIVGT